MDGPALLPAPGRYVAVLASVPAMCAVCRGARALIQESAAGLELVACPHCGQGQTVALPLIYLPWRQDVRRTS